MSSEDEEDEFLYGSEVPSAKRQKQDNDNSEEKKDEEVSNAPSLGDRLGGVQKSNNKETEKKEDDEIEDNDEDDEEEASDDSDIEFVIDTKPGQKAEPPSRNAAPHSQVKSTDGASTNEQTGEESKPAGLDIEAVADYEGKPITQISLESFEEKPWRQPGADITDYFNYGFDEFTWTAYCSKQDNLREDYNPQKVMNQMMGGGAGVPNPGGAGAGGGMGMPMDMPMFPPEFMQQMMGGFPPMNMGGMPMNGMPQQPQGGMPPQQQQMPRQQGGGGSHQPSQGNTPQPPNQRGQNNR